MPKIFMNICYENANHPTLKSNTNTKGAVSFGTAPLIGTSE